MKQQIRELESAHGLGKTEHASWHEEFPFTRVGPIPDGQKVLVQHVDFPIFPINPRLAQEYLGDGIVGGAYSIRDDAMMAKLLLMYVTHLTYFLASLPCYASQG